MRKRRLMGLALLCTAGVGLGCSEDPEPSPTPPPDAGTAAVHVRRVLRHLTANGYVEQPEDFTRNPVELFVLDGDTLAPVTGKAGGVGEYVFPDVRPGTYYVKQGTTYVVTDSHDVDLSVNRLGRPGVVALAQEGRWDVAVTGLESWNALGSGRLSSELQLVSEQVGTTAVVWPDLETGATSGTEENVLYAVLSGAPMRFEAEKGDRAWVLQHSSQSLESASGGTTENYRAVVRAFQTPPVSHDADQPLRIEGTFQPLSMQQLSLDWRVSSFVSQATEVHPAAATRGSSFQLRPVAHGPAEGVVGYSGELLSFARTGQRTEDVAGTLVYGNPYPAHWGVMASVSTRYTVSLAIPGEQPHEASVSTTVTDRLSAISAGPVIPRIRPPRGLTLDGTDATPARTVTSDAHVVAWQPPVEGTADAYAVAVYRLDWFEDLSARYAETAARFLVDGKTTSVRLPAGLLEAGQYYYFTVRALSAGGYDVSNKPLMIDNGIAAGTAGAISGLLSVPRT